jgi:hypothetical protein
MASAQISYVDVNSCPRLIKFGCERVFLLDAPESLKRSLFAVSATTSSGDGSPCAGHGNA